MPLLNCKVSYKNQLNGNEIIMVCIFSVMKCGFISLVKVKVTLVQALRLCTGRTAHRGSRVIAPPFHDRGTRRGEGSASRLGRSLTPRKTRYLLYRRLGGPQCRYGYVRKILPPPGFDPRTVQAMASRYNDYATRPTISLVEVGKCSKLK
jgi:hypothetical protein